MLILDDSASALDFKTDAALRHAIRSRSQVSGATIGDGGYWLAGKNVAGAADAPANEAVHPAAPLTTVIVSQRVSSVRDADLICVMRRGKVVGLGTHDELLRSCKVYREICLSQLKREELGLNKPAPGEGLDPGLELSRSSHAEGVA